jgi:hypothetical protein
MKHVITISSLIIEMLIILYRNTNEIFNKIPNGKKSVTCVGHIQVKKNIIKEDRINNHFYKKLSDK